MSGFALAILAALAGAAAGTPRASPATLEKPEIATARVAACGFKDARPRFDDETQEDVIEVPVAASASEDQLRCVALASLASSYYVRFPSAVEQAYEPLYWRLAGEQQAAASRLWLEKRGLLSRLPKFDPGQSDLTLFAQALERLCGRRATGTLQAMRDAATFKPGALGTVTKRGFSRGKLDEETLMCLLHAASASGYPLMFIGNEAYGAPQ